MLILNRQHPLHLLHLLMWNLKKLFHHQLLLVGGANSFIFFSIQFTLYIYYIIGSHGFAGLHAAGRPSDDADSRTIFVNNVISYSYTCVRIYVEREFFV